MKRRVVGIGELLWDVFPGYRKAGGAPANFVFHMSAMGLPASLVSAVGDDSDGAELIDEMESRGIKGIIEQRPFPTGKVIVSLDHNGMPSYDILKDVAWDHIVWNDEIESLASQTRAVCFGTLSQRSPESRNTVQRFVKSMPDDSNTYKVFDINLRQEFYSRKIVEESLVMANVLKLNEEELPIICHWNDVGSTDIPRAARAVLRIYGLKYVIVTCGATGSYVLTEDAESYLPTPKVDVVDTVGAGDSFTSAFVASLIYGFSLTEAHKRAVEVSAFVCTNEGATPVLPDNLCDFSVRH